LSPDAVPGTFIVDTCTIINFAVAARLDLLETTLEGRGRWTESAADEINRAANHWPTLWTIQLACWLGEPIAPDREGDTDAVFRLQRQLGGTRREPRKHLAEAEAIHLVLCYPEFSGTIFLTDDRSAADLANKRGVNTWRSADVLSAAYRDGRIGCPAAYEVLLDMEQAGRGVHVPADHQLVCP
jgi:predicted nucleic acid-binding protein